LFIDLKLIYINKFSYGFDGFCFFSFWINGKQDRIEYGAAGLRKNVRILYLRQKSFNDAVFFQTDLVTMRSENSEFLIGPA